MINRRAFAAMIASTFAASQSSWGQPATRKTVFYSAVGPDLTLYDMDLSAATLTRRNTVTLPANVQYAWPHPSSDFFYVVSSNGEPGGGAGGNTHIATAFRIDPVSGALTKHGPEQRLPQRPIHASVDGSGQFLMIAFNQPSNVGVHRINPDGTLGAPVQQKEKLDTGIFAHQIRTTPGNTTATLVTRGNSATAARPEEPGAIKVFRFIDGQLTGMQSIASGNNGYGFGPRHLDYHPTKPWLYASIELQSQIYMYSMNADGSLAPQPSFIKSTLAMPQRPRVAQGAGTIHIHPNGRFAYIPNRAPQPSPPSGTVKFEGDSVAAVGENDIAVFALNQQTGEPTLIQNIDGHGIQLRTFAIDPTGRLLIAASIQALQLRNGNRITDLSAGLSVYRVGDDGRLTFARKYDVDTARGTQFWSGMVTLA